MRKSFLTASLFTALSIFSPAHANEDALTCELDRPVMFGGLDWDSNQIHTAIARFIVEHGLGCKTDVLPGSTLPMLAGMARGDIDITMEIWKDNVTEAWNRALRRRQVVEVGVNFPDAVQGWYVPAYVIHGDPERGIEPMAPNLRSVQDLPDYTEFFEDPEVPGKGRFHNCILGWSCEVVNTNKLIGYELLDSYTNFRPGAAAALAAAISSAYRRGEPIVAYYWGPTWVLGRYELVQLEEPAYEKAQWEAFNEDPEDHTPTAYPEVAVIIGANADFAEEAPEIIGFLKNYRTSAALISGILDTMEEKDLTAEEAALAFMREQPEIWQAWLSASAGQRVTEALSAEDS